MAPGARADELVVDEHAPQDIRISRWALLAIFFINGAAAASWIAHIPLIQEKFGLSVGALGLVLLASSAGGMFALTFLGRMVERRGSRMVLRVATLAYCATLPVLILAPVMPLLVVALFIFGMGNSGMNISMNAQGVAIERRYGRPILSTFHALYSVGNLAGAVVSSLLLAQGVSAKAQVIGITLVLVIAAIVVLRPLLPPSIDQRSPTAPVVVRLSGVLLGMGGLAFFVLIAEMTMNNWSTVYMSRVLGTDAAVSAIGYTAFTLMMAVGRFCGDAVRARLSTTHVLQLCAGLAAAGLACSVLVDQPIAVIIGFGCVGFGLANTIPVLFGAAGKLPGIAPGAGIAAVSAAGSVGILVSAPFVGFTAELTTLPIALGLVAVMLALVALLVPRVLTRTS